MGKEQKRPKWPPVDGHQQMEKIQGMKTQSSTMYIQKGHLAHCDVGGIGEHYAMSHKSHIENKKRVHRAMAPKRIEHTSAGTRVVAAKGWKARRMGTQRWK